MKFFYAPYSLQPINDFSGVHKASEGLLLKFIDDESDEESFSLYHPIESLGDLSLNRFLLSKEERLPLLDKILGLRIKPSENLEGVASSYYLSSSQNNLLRNKNKIFNEGFSVVKLKAKSLVEIDFDRLESLPFDYILDFNGREDIVNFEALDLKSKYFLERRVKYVEDPYMKGEKLSFKLASDFIDYKELSDYFIVKPTGFNHDTLIDLGSKEKPEKYVVTSYLDHPIGQFLSAKWAICNKVPNLGGFWTHSEFKANQYSELFVEPGKINLNIKDDFLNLLNRENWRPL